MQKQQNNYWSDADLFAKLNERNEYAFAQVFREYYAALCYYASKFVFDKQEAEDIVEEVFEKLWSKDLEITNARHLRSYLYMATKRVSLDHLRKSDHSKERQMNFATEIGDQEPSHINEIIRTEVLKEIYLAIQNLPEQCSKIVSMSYIEGFKNEEIAEKMGLSVQTIKNQKTRGLTILRTKLSSEHFMVFVLLSHQILG
ncbi:RNA polymerase sigma-70 factor [Pedobacter nutrimenti]|uniref:RNA polymerase sigma factor n=1 Tax=Pedobacter nutrimenti TaxID=1241337 RepID=UPI00292E1115|nr:RNA polymerase sigma-70 factor [Pedobacter nutrimenti]